MRYKLSFCEVEQLSENVFEVTVNEGVTIDEKCAKEAELFWQKTRTEPFGILLNNNNNFSFSFLGSKKIGEHALEQKTAVLVSDSTSKDQMSTVHALKKFPPNRKAFTDREEAIKWLETP